MSRRLYTLSMLVLLGSGTTQAQEPGNPTRPLPPIFRALDRDQDGVISADEIANATVALKTLDANGDGRLTPDEYRPPRPGEAVQPRSGGRSKPAGAGEAPVAGNADPSDSRPGSGSDQETPEDQPPPTGNSGQKPPRPKIDEVLDVNGDEIISAGELANAPVQLRKLDANGDGKLSKDECFGRPAGERSQRGGQP